MTLTDLQAPLIKHIYTKVLHNLLLPAHPHGKLYRLLAAEYIISMILVEYYLISN